MRKLEIPFKILHIMTHWSKTGVSRANLRHPTNTQRIGRTKNLKKCSNNIRKESTDHNINGLYTYDDVWQMEPAPNASEEKCEKLELFARSKKRKTHSRLVLHQTICHLKKWTNCTLIEIWD